MTQTNLTWKPENHFHNLDTAYVQQTQTQSVQLQVTLALTTFQYTMRSQWVDRIKSRNWYQNKIIKRLVWYKITSAFNFPP